MQKPGMCSSEGRHRERHGDGGESYEANAHFRRYSRSGW
jgi:hypothetical protein